MEPIQQQVIEALSDAEKQEVLDFAEFFNTKRQRLSSPYSLNVYSE